MKEYKAISATNFNKEQCKPYPLRCGELFLCEKGEGQPCLMPQASDIAALLPDRSPYSSKRDFGYVGIAGGCESYSGAPTLSAMALSSLRCGAGVARVILPESIIREARAFAPEPTYYALPDFLPENGLSRAIASLKALGVGVGWGRSADRVTALEYLLTDFSGTLIIDADGLYALRMLGEGRVRTAKPMVVLTPHLHEFSELCGIPCEEINANPVQAAVSYAKLNGVILLLKGAVTVVTNGVQVYACAEGTVGMATAGSGDVLLGVITGLSGFLPPLQAALVGTYVCGVAGKSAAKKLGEYGMLSTDTIKEIALAVKHIKEGNC